MSGKGSTLKGKMLPNSKKKQFAPTCSKFVPFKINTFSEVM